MRSIRLVIVFLAIITVSSVYVLVDLLPIQAENQPEIDQNQGISEFRSDGVEIVHYEDGSKLYRASMHDGITTSDDLR